MTQADRFRIDEPMPRGEINYRKWVLDVLSWDGILPACTFGVAWLGAKLFPANQFGQNAGWGEVLMIAVPIVGVLARFYIGKHKISTNHCGPWFRALQYLCLCMTVFFFMILDFFVVLGALVRQGPLIGWGDVPTLVCVAAVYLCVVGCTMYPGRSPVDQVNDRFAIE